jgi:hypothetical protein
MLRDKIAIALSHSLNPKPPIRSVNLEAQMDLKRARALAEQEDFKRRRELRELFEHIEYTPKDHIVKGMYVGGVHDTLKAHGVSNQSRLFKRSGTIRSATTWISCSMRR